jgi:hypothetical protein
VKDYQEGRIISRKEGIIISEGRKEGSIIRQEGRKNYQ